MCKTCFLGVDIGSYETKGVLVSITGKIIASFSTGHTISFPKPGWAEHDADKVWWYDFLLVTKKLLSVSGISAENVKSVCVSGIGQCVLPIDVNGKPLSPAILYGIDTRCSRECDEIRQMFGAKKITEICGTGVDTQAAGPRILWYRNKMPEVYEKADCYMNSNSYIVYKLTGEKVIDVYSASDSIPFIDIRKLEYIPEMTEPIVPMSSLPRLTWSSEIVGKITKEASELTGLMEGTPVAAGTTDAGSEALAAGVCIDYDCMIMLGSSSFFVEQVPELEPNDEYWSCPFLVKGRNIIAASMNTGGSITRWFRDQFAERELQLEQEKGVNAYSQLSDILAQTKPGANGLIALPYFYGERFMLHDADLKGSVIGLTLNHTKADVYRALIESICFGIRETLEFLGGSKNIPKRLFAVGGGTKNKTWMQILSDVLQKEIKYAVGNPGACYGDAFLGALGTGYFHSLDDMDKWERKFISIDPNPRNKEIYNEFFSLYQETRNATRNINHRLKEISQKYG